jgi:cytochrome c oxidase assembly protein subunit 15
MKSEKMVPKSSVMLHNSDFMLHPSSFSPWPHRLAVVTACATVPLLFIGGLVTSKGAGLAVPDWPTTFGYNMFLYPWSKMIGNIFYEHSHRLVASAVGLLTIALAATFWFAERRPWVRWLGVSALGLVIVQGILGGLRVVLLEQTLAIVHAAAAQAFFALTVSLAIFTSEKWRDERENPPLTDGRRLCRLCAITTAFIYLQVIFGAVLRHTGERVDAHLLFAALVTLHVALIFIRVIKHYAHHPQLLRPTQALGVLLVAQLMLGVASYLAKFTGQFPLAQGTVVLLTTTHLVVGSLMLITSLLLTLRCFRFSSLSTRRVEARVLREQFSL